MIIQLVFDDFKACRFYIEFFDANPMLLHGHEEVIAEFVHASIVLKFNLAPFDWFYT